MSIEERVEKCVEIMLRRQSESEEPLLAKWLRNAVDCAAFSSGLHNLDVLLPEQVALDFDALLGDDGFIDGDGI